MTMILLAFFLIYGSMHYLAYRRLPLAGPGPALVLALLFLAPVLVHLLAARGWVLLATVLAWLGYTWMGLLFLWCCATGATALIGLVLPAPWRERLPSLALGLTAVVFLYGLVEAHALQVRHLEFPVATITKPLRLLFVSDHHLGLLEGKKGLARLLARIRDLAPDAVLGGGDLIDANLDHQRQLAEMWRQYRPPLGKFAVLGNHEYYAGVERSLDFLAQAGFTALADDKVQLAPGIELVGLDDDIAPHFGRPRKPLVLAPGSGYRIVLRHRPIPAPFPFDLQLSGHVHGGQIFPFSLVTRLFFPVRAGVNDLADGGTLVVSRGAGTWGPPIRVLAPPDLVVVDLLPR